MKDFFKQFLIFLYYAYAIILVMEKIDNKRTYHDLMFPGSFVGATLTAAGIKKSLIIFHGIAGCNIEAIHFRSDQIPGGSYVPVIPTGLNESDCIYGGNEKLFRTLRDTIAQSKKQNRPPDIVFILTSDAPSIVGDDIHTAARVVQEETGINIIAADTPGFLGGVSTGTDIILAELLNKYSIKNNNTQKKNYLNLIAPYLIGSKNWNNDSDEIIRLLEASGISVNLNLCRNLTLQDIKKFDGAAYNLNLCGEEMPSFEKQSFELGVKNYYRNLPLPLGAANTEEWLLNIAKDIGDEEKAKEILIADQKFAQKQLRFNYNFSWMSTLMYQKKCGLLSHAKFGASLARCLLWDFGIIPKVIGLIAETERAKNEAMELLDEIKGQAEFEALINPTYFEYGNALKKADVDFSIGSIQDKPLSLGQKIPHLSLCGFNFFNQYNFIPYPNMGIRGILGLLTELSRIMEETFYLKDMISAYNYKGHEVKQD